MKYLIPILFIVSCVLAFLFGRKTSYRNNVVIDTDTITIFRVDTVRKVEVKAKNIYIDRVLKDTFFSTDTVKVEILVPISKYVFTDSLYRAEISGYNVSLDHMEVYGRTIEKKIYVPYHVKNNKRWGMGVSAGYAITPQGFQPYIGLGLQYNLISF